MTTMNERALTQGEWRANNLTTGDVLRVRRGRKVVAEIPYHGDYSTWADARLIAAAPDLLRALQACRGQWIHSVNAEQCLAALRKAIGDA